MPSGRIAPRAALWFGFALAAASFVELTLFVNLLAASLALLGFIGYTAVYTVWLKRTTPQNIVIGGAAGAAIDLDVYTYGPEIPSSLQDVVAWCVAAHDYEKRAFFRLIPADKLETLVEEWE